MVDLEKIKQYAKEKHHNQFRKFGNIPYVNHPIKVAEMVKKHTDDKEVIAAAYLHDVLEDTPTTYDEILGIFGKKIADLVQELTNDEYMKKKMGKRKYLTLKINNLSEEARLIKFFDRLDNVRDLNKSNKSFASYYANNTNYILRNISVNLLDIEKEIINKIKKHIKPFLEKN
jgi:(p)ppGpp synthase/HD superfamily hydrolase